MTRIFPDVSWAVQPTRDAAFDLTGIHYIREQREVLPKVASSLHIFCLGTSHISTLLSFADNIVIIVVSALLWGCFDAWSANLFYGFGPTLISFVLITSVDLILACCLVEMMVAFPTVGGIVDFTRITMGHLPSFLCGVAACVDFGTGSPFATIFFANYIAEACNWQDSNGILYICAGLHIFSALLILRGGRVLWNSMVITTAISILLLILYLIAGMKYGNFESYALNPNGLLTDDFSSSNVIDTSGMTPGIDRRLSSSSIPTVTPTGTPTSMPTIEPNPRWFAGGAKGIFSTLPFAYWMFTGIEIASVTGEEMLNSELSIPKGILPAAVLSYSAMLCCMFVGVSLPPGPSQLSDEPHPITIGIHMLFPSLPPSIVLGICSIGALATVTPWMYSFSRQLFALSRKGFLPTIFSNVYNGRPYVSTVFGIFSGYGIVLLLIVSGEHPVAVIVEVVANLGSILTAFFAFLSFIIFRTKFPQIQRKFRSPFGIAGAAYGFFLLVTTFVFDILSSLMNIAAIFYLLGGLFIVWSFYYYFIARKTLVLDQDERNAIINGIDVNALLRTEYGYAYLELHCIREHNTESLYCLNVRKIIQ